MDLEATLRTTGAVREFLPEAIDDATLYRLFDVARFAPSGGNRQGWRVIVVKDPQKRRRLRDLYLMDWYKYLALASSGLVPWAPIGDRDAEAAALAHESAFADAAAANAPGFAESLDTAPALVLVLADLTALAAVDRDLDRYTFAGGASIYPFVWSLLLAARAEGLAGVMTTIAIRREDDVRQLFDIPSSCALAALVALGRPVSAPKRLGRKAVDDFAWVDRFGGASLRDH